MIEDDAIVFLASQDEGIAQAAYFVGRVGERGRRRVVRPDYCSGRFKPNETPAEKMNDALLSSRAESVRPTFA
jgi:hypothetical protein